MALDAQLAQEEQPKKLYSSQFWWLCLSAVLFMGSFNMIIPELPDYLIAMGGEDYLGLIIGLFTLMAGISRPISGKLSDTIGRRPVMIFGGLVCVVLGLLYPMVGSVWAFLLLRLVHGMSTGFKPTGTTALLADITPDHRRAEALGILGVCGSIGMGAGPALGGWIAQVWSLDAMFYLSSVFALLSVVTILGIEETLPNPQRFRPNHLLVKRSEIVEKRVLTPTLVMLLTIFAFGTVLTVAPLLSTKLGIGNKGMFFTVFVITSMVVRLVTSRVSDRYGRVPVLIFGVLFLILGLAMVSVSGMLLEYEHAWLVFLGGAALYGISVGLNAPSLYAWAVDLAQPQFKGRAMGTLQIGMEIGILLGAVFSAFVFDNDPSKFGLTFAISSLVAAAALFVLILVYRWPERLGIPDPIVGEKPTFPEVKPELQPAAAEK